MNPWTRLMARFRAPRPLDTPPEGGHDPDLPAARILHAEVIAKADRVIIRNQRLIAATRRYNQRLEGQNGQSH